MKRNNKAGQIGNFLADILQRKRQNEQVLKQDNTPENRLPLPNKGQTKKPSEK